MSCRNCGHGFDLYEKAADAPHGPRPCPSCRSEAATQDYARKGVQVGFTDPVQLVRVPKGARTGDTRVRGQRNRAAVTRQKWREMCKVNDWTDLSDSSGPPDDHLSRETFPNTSGGLADIPVPVVGSSGEGEVHRFTYRGEE